MSSLDDTSLELPSGEVIAQRADGMTFHAEINASLLENVSGDMFIISLRDASDRIRAEIALRENEERYRALVENAPEAIIVFDVDNNRFVDANEKACTLFNLSRSRLLTIGPDAISPKTQPDGTPSFGIRRGYVDAAFNGDHPTFEWMHQDSTGRRIPCEVRFSNLPSDDKRLLRVSQRINIILPCAFGGAGVLFRSKGVLPDAQGFTADHLGQCLNIGNRAAGQGCARAGLRQALQEINLAFGGLHPQPNFGPHDAGDIYRAA